MYRRNRIYMIDIGVGKGEEEVYIYWIEGIWCVLISILVL